ncbi:hypothetical protein SEPCBS57363_003697 [Sporothrix epigloea]|uniref:Uncharacterized protein n=1 Tax=Sporothrix epigloea TaxID=1892477 RepID=A0ABP0DRL1_9PEZI
MPSANIAITSCTYQDFRGANHKQQRRTNHSLKWDRKRCTPNCLDCQEDDTEYQSKEPLATCLRDENRSKNWEPRLDSSNANKLHRSTVGTKPLRRNHTTTDALAEIQIANTMSSSYLINSSTYTPPVCVAIPDNGAPLHSFDMLDSPLHSLPLAAFVKEPSVRDTERMVNREYEIVDSNGATATGRRARELLRRSPTLCAIPATDGDFELI